MEGGDEEVIQVISRHNEMNCHVMCLVIRSFMHSITIYMYESTSGNEC